MIYLEEQKLIFLKPKKVAGTSFEIALSKWGRHRDVVTPIHPTDEPKRKELDFTGPQNYRYRISDFFSGTYSPRKIAASLYRRELPVKFYNHITAEEVRRLLGAASFDGAFKLSIVRNPFSQLISFYHWRQGRNAAPADFSRWLRSEPGLINSNLKQYHVAGEWVVDHCIRFEKFEEDIRAFEAQHDEFSGLWDIFSGINAKGNIRPGKKTAQDYYRDDRKLIEAVTFFNAPIFERFGYEFPR